MTLEGLVYGTELWGVIDYSASQSNPTVQWMHRDGMRSVVERTANLSSGATRAAGPFRYDAFGGYRTTPEAAQPVADGQSKVGYTGHVFDVETGLVYAKARYYQPELGRWLSQDALEGQMDRAPSLNRYAYALENPYRYWDPTGHDDEVAGTPPPPPTPSTSPSPVAQSDAVSADAGAPSAGVPPEHDGSTSMAPARETPGAPNATTEPEKKAEPKGPPKVKEQPRLTVKDNALVVPEDQRKESVNLNVEHIDQHDVEKEQGLKKNTGCHATCVVAITKTERKEPTEHGRVKIAVPGTEDSQGRFEADKTKADEGRAHIDKSLDEGHPVEVGLSHTKYTPGYNDGITDHWVVIKGRTYDEQGHLMYPFMDPGGADSEFYVDAVSRKMFKEGTNPASRWTGQRDYQVSQVRKTESK